MNRRFFVKQKIALILIGFSLIAIAAILYILDRSSDLDNEHIALVENSEKIETRYMIFESSMAITRRTQILQYPSLSILYLPKSIRISKIFKLLLPKNLNSTQARIAIS